MGMNGEKGDIVCTDSFLITSTSGPPKHWIIYTSLNSEIWLCYIDIA